jgi:hypothetical protein
MPLVLTKLIEEAQQVAHRALYGDTLASMASALLLYRDMGFVEVEPYSIDPTPGAIYLRLDCVLLSTADQSIEHSQLPRLEVARTDRRIARWPTVSSTGSCTTPTA